MMEREGGEKTELLSEEEVKNRSGIHDNTDTAKEMSDEAGMNAAMFAAESLAPDTETAQDKIYKGIIESDLSLLEDGLKQCPNREELSFDGLPLIHFICSQRNINPQILQNQLDAGADVNQPSTEGTPLQVACKYGVDQVVTLLLDYGAWLESADVPVYDLNSPFYLASSHGYSSIIDRLFLYQPSMSCSPAPIELVKDMKVRTCLLYAACLGGNKKIINQWFMPEMDINHPPYYTSEGTFSMDKTPLYAACSGNHLEVAKSLMELGATLNQQICEDFPDLTAQLLQNCIEKVEQEDDDDQDQENTTLKLIANYSHRWLGGFPESWLSQYRCTLVELNLSYNNIRRLPPSVPWSLPSLLSFNASFNKLTSFLVDSRTVVECRSLEEIFLQNNKLEELCYELFQLPALKNLNLAHNSLKYLVKSHQNLQDWKDMTQENKKPEWRCPNLSVLNASNNELVMLPIEMKTCSGLHELDASFNKLTAFPPPWECKLVTLNLCNNQLERFAPSVELYWCGTLRKLLLNDNLLEEVTESMVKLCCLQVLDLSNNRISSLPRPEVWDCQTLQILDLSNNKLGQIGGDNPVEPPSSLLKRIKRRSRTSVTIDNVSAKIAFPSFLAHCLNELNVSSNNLDCIPLSICNLVSLQTLDLSKNPAIRLLPKELGKLSHCNNLYLHGTSIPSVTVDHKYMSSLDNQIWAKEKIQVLCDELRQSKPYYKVKLIVVGKKDKGKTAITNILGGRLIGDNQAVGIHRVDAKLYPPKRKGSLGIKRDDGSKPPIDLCIWDMSGDECYAATHHCFFTPNSLYLVVWDLWSLSKDINKIGKLLYSIEARNPNSRVVLAATFLDKNMGVSQGKEVAEIKAKLLDVFGSVSERYGGLCSQLEENNVIPMSCTNGEGVNELKEKLYNAAIGMEETSRRFFSKRPLLGRRIPNSYILIEKEMYRELEERHLAGKPPFLLQEEFHNLIANIPGCDVDIPQEIPEVVKFLMVSGTILHFNEQLMGLKNFYYLDPTWLCDVLSIALLDSDETQTMMKGGKIPLTTVQKMYIDDPRFPNENVPQYIQLLEQFEIGLKVESDRKLFIPSHLHKNPGIESHFEEGKKVCRLYQLAFIPNGLWSRLLSRIMSRVELLTNDWVLRTSVRIKPGKSFYRTNSHSNRGLKIDNKDMVYWEDGMFLRHSTGHFILESVFVGQQRGYSSQGILISVHSTKEDYSIMGMIVDAIDDLLTDHFPGLMDFDQMGQPRIQRFALCPVCYNFTSRILPSDLNHFTVEHCARLLLSMDSVTCEKGVKIPLSHLVPELLMLDLPKKFILDQEKLQVNASNKNAYLGSGVTGSVFKGKYGDMEIAAKYYHGSPNMPGKNSLEKSSIDSSYCSGGNVSNVEQAGSEDDTDDYINAQKFKVSSQDHDEANSIKAWRAFTEMRQEVDVTSKLDHPCIINFIGISIKPDLLMCLEFAPLGSLRRVLDKEIDCRESFNKYRDKDKVFLPVFNKELTFKLVYQIVRGLEYLHKHDIIYRDLKSDNLLVTSLDLEVPVNVKLSDYGISKFSSSGGMVGLVGTPGYQAPEIMEGLAYDEKVDMFSLSMVIYEILSGQRPYCEYKNMAQISQAVKVEAKRPSLKDYNIDPHFPMLERLMSKCWDQEAVCRPSATDILSTNYMMSANFLSQHKLFTKEMEELDLVASVTEPENAKTQFWMWEGSGDDRCYHIIDATTCVLQVYRKPLPGATVTCMAKIGKEIWIGTEDEKIEIFGQKGVGHPTTIKKMDRLNATPTCILYHEQDDNGSKKVYVLLNNGQLKLYSFMKKEHLSPTTAFPEDAKHFTWQDKKTLRLSKRKSGCMTYVSENQELWCGCGNEIVIISDKTEMIEKRIELSKECSFLQHKEKSEILQMTCNDGRMWALIEKSAEVLEFDTDLGILTHIFKCDDLNPHHMIVSKYLHSSSVEVKAEPFHQRDSNSSEDSVESVSTEDIDMWMLESEKIQPVHVPATEPLSLGPLPPNAADVPPVDTPPPVPKRSYSISDHNRPLKSPPVPPRQKGMTLPSQPTKFMTLPSLPSHSKSSDQLHNLESCPVENGIFVNSMISVGDSLWVGRSNGDILIIDTKSHTDGGHGCVMAVLNPHCDSSCQEVESLVAVGSLVFSVHKVMSKHTHITAWEAYDSSQIKTLEKYWSRPMSFRKSQDLISMGNF